MCPEGDWDEFVANVVAKMAMLRLDSDDDQDHRNHARKTANLSDSACQHPIVFGNLCGNCGNQVSAENYLPFSYVQKGLKVSRIEVARLRKEEMQNNLLRNKKLVLVLDLDQTLIQSKNLEHFTSKELYLLDEVKSSQEVSKKGLFMLQCGKNLDFFYLLKLRPFVHEFLEQASKLFVMYVYTMGSRDYARKIVELIDPENKYFSRRVISRTDSYRDRKELDLVLGPKKAVVIVDDSDKIWRPNCFNVLKVKEYNYFASGPTESKSYSERKEDETEIDVLSTTLEALKMIHTQFFNPQPIAERDVRCIIPMVLRNNPSLASSLG